MDKKAVFEHYCGVLDHMLEDSWNLRVFLQAPYTHDGDYDFDYGCIKFGATRGTIIDNDYDYVVKFDVDTDDTDEYVSDREIAIYQYALEKNVAQYFTEACFLGTYTKSFEWYSENELGSDTNATEEEFRALIEEEKEKGLETEWVTISIPLFGYEKADCDRYCCANTTPEEDAFLHNHPSPLSERSENVAAAFVHEYGIENYLELSTFCAEYGVNDLHEYNIGYINNRIVIIDFAGYHCEEDD